MTLPKSKISNTALADEIVSINAIYPSPPALTLLHSPSIEASFTNPSSTDATLLLAHPVTPITFTLSVPATYPAIPPSVTGTFSIGSRPRGEGAAAIQVLRETITKVWREGEVCLFDLVEEATALLEPGDDDGVGATGEDDGEQAQWGHRDLLLAPEKGGDEHTTSTKDARLNEHGAVQATDAALALALEWTSSTLITEKKSSFIAWAAPVASRDQALQAIEHLLAANKKISTATHNITAYRTRAGSAVQQDYDDDGETAAGGRVLHLMQLMDVWNAVVVVSRWYGGVKLGPDRFRIINSVAKEALVKGAVAGKDEEGQKRKGYKPRGKK